ncbi:MAG: hypothetical protein JSS32_01545 [Verrucomicrobia bacterium]|nr:hypothetical protein [Verrucomicrobiota bacterium]
MEIDDIWVKIGVYKKEIWIGGASLLAVGALVFGLGSGPTYREYLNTELAFAKWEASPGNSELFQELSRVLKKTPELKDKYDARIAQKLIEANLSDKALPYAERVIARLQEESPLHALFVETTLMIEKKAFQEALESAMSLKEKIGTDDSVLYAHNLLRIAFLQQALENGPGEMAAWRDFEDFLEWKNGPSESILSQEMIQSYQDRDVDLAHYIAYRKVSLSQG